MSCLKSQLGGIDGLVSLYDMLTYAADIFCLLSDAIGRIVGSPLLAVGGALQNTGYKQEIISRLQVARELCQEHDWPETYTRIKEVEEYLSGKNGVVLPAVLQHKFADLENHLLRILRDNVFLHANQNRLEEFNKLADDAQEVKELFPNAFEEIWHARTCYLFGEPVASVFHSMRALEIGLGAFARAVGRPPQNKDQWEKIINDIETEIKNINGPHAGADWKRKQELYSGAALHFRYLKNAWRNHVMHVRHSYDDKKALGILRHVMDFLSGLTSELGLRELGTPQT